MYILRPHMKYVSYAKVSPHFLRSLFQSPSWVPHALLRLGARLPNVPASYADNFTKAYPGLSWIAATNTI